jgi:SAM-dependent methyltransferase
MSNEKFDSEQLKQISDTTIGHYDNSARSFWQGTKDHDVTQNYEALLKAIKGEPPFKILDFGCGPGRDLLYFNQAGHEPVGLDGSAEFVKMAVELSGVKVLHQNFINLDLPEQYFDGIFANASLFHIPSQEFPRVLQELHKSLKKDGILFCSNPRGNAEGWSGERYGSYYEFPEMNKFLEDAGFAVLEHYYRPPGLPREHQPWLAIVSVKRTLSYPSTSLRGR